MKVSVAAVVVGERIREDMGDIAGLAQSMADLGLFHPIVVTRDLCLVCGHRRLLAAKRLGWREIEATAWEDIDPETRREMEREENERRKPLTDYERSKRRVKEAEEAVPEIAEAKAAVSPTAGETDRHPGGRPSKAEVSRREQAQAIGVGEETLRRAEQHVAAVETLGVPAELPQATALRVAAIPEEQRAAIIGKLGAAKDEGKDPRMVVGPLLRDAEKAAAALAAAPAADGEAQEPADKRAQGIDYLRRGWTQKRVAETLDVKPHTVSYWARQAGIPAERLKLGPNMAVVREGISATQMFRRIIDRWSDTQEIWDASPEGMAAVPPMVISEVLRTIDHATAYFASVKSEILKSLNVAELRKGESAHGGR